MSVVLENAKMKLISAASKLFYENGLVATGIDSIVKESGVSKMTLYKYFPSKQDLVISVLKERDDQWMTWFIQHVESASKNPVEKLIAIFDVLDSWFKDPDFRGCAFLKSVSEYCDPAHPIHQQAMRHFENVGQFVNSLVSATNATEPENLINSLNLLVMGCIGAAYGADDPNSAIKAKETAIRIIKSHGLTV